LKEPRNATKSSSLTPEGLRRENFRKGGAPVERYILSKFFFCSFLYARGAAKRENFRKGCAPVERYILSTFSKKKIRHKGFKEREFQNTGAPVERYIVRGSYFLVVAEVK
jgi:hypothetical protein